MVRFIVTTIMSNTMRSKILILTTVLLMLLGYFSSVWSQQVPVPSHVDEMNARVKELRQHYDPWLRSLPEKIDVRQRQELSNNGVWRWKIEVEGFGGKERPETPDWYRPDFDDSGWEITTVPEWRYDEPIAEGENPEVHYYPSNRGDRGRITWYRTSFSSTLPQGDQRSFLQFDGVTWEAQVWLNGVFLGSHTAYFEDFRFDITKILKEKDNVLAVRVLSGPFFNEPVTEWTVLSGAAAGQPRQVRDEALSILDRRPLIGFRRSIFESGNGIFREVYVEHTGAAIVNRIFVRGDATGNEATVRVEMDAIKAATYFVDMQILPENFDQGTSWKTSETVSLVSGSTTQVWTVQTPDSKRWTQNEPCMYRCRVTLRDEQKVLDVQDVLFGFRTFRLATTEEVKAGIPDGMMMLNDTPVYLRGVASSAALNTYWYWKQDDRLIDTILMARAANFNAIRSCEHICLPKVREYLDRLGMLSEQDLSGYGMGDVPKEFGGAGKGNVELKTVVELCSRFARTVYNNPGVVLIVPGGIETGYDPLQMVEAVLKEDPERIMKPITGNMFGWGTAYDGKPPHYTSLSEEQWKNVVNDFHNYNMWYGYRNVPLCNLADGYSPGRMITCGEYGAEALDCYETMLKYPPALQPPPPDTPGAPETLGLWAHVQVEKDDPRAVIGLRGRMPETLQDYIEGSQTYYADAASEQTTGFRISPSRIGGSFIFHLCDALAAEWSKSIIGFDGTPKKVYYAMAQVNQPVVPLFRFRENGKKLEIWVANDTMQNLSGCSVSWEISAVGISPIGVSPMTGKKSVETIPAIDATLVTTLDMPQGILAANTVMVQLKLNDANGRLIAKYGRDVYFKAWTVSP